MSNSQGSSGAEAQALCKELKIYHLTGEGPEERLREICPACKVERAIERAIQAERERCARLAEGKFAGDFDNSQRKWAGKDIAAAIRASSTEPARPAPKREIPIDVDD